jgi:hypothetical protein
MAPEANLRFLSRNSIARMSGTKRIWGNDLTEDNNSVAKSNTGRRANRQRRAAPAVPHLLQSAKLSHRFPLGISPAPGSSL